MRRVILGIFSAAVLVAVAAGCSGVPCSSLRALAALDGPGSVLEEYEGWVRSEAYGDADMRTLRLAELARHREALRAALELCEGHP